MHILQPTSCMDPVNFPRINTGCPSEINLFEEEGGGSRPIYGNFTIIKSFNFTTNWSGSSRSLQE